eukprot:m.116270 g.116270  ORF g.116270 m.116270 type:complete len:71 (+) comp13602_c0_seq2:2324-2536(+)
MSGTPPFDRAEVMLVGWCVVLWGADYVRCDVFVCWNNKNKTRLLLVMMSLRCGKGMLELMVSVGMSVVDS